MGSIAEEARHGQGARRVSAEVHAMNAIGVSVSFALATAPTGQAAPFPVASWPTETFPSGQKNMFLNGEGIEIPNQQAAEAIVRARMQTSALIDRRDVASAMTRSAAGSSPGTNR